MHFKLAAVAIVSVVIFITQTPAISADMKLVTDVSGNQVEIPVNPKRIAIAWDRGMTELFVGAGIDLVAVASRHEFAPFLMEALNNLEGIADLGSHREINIEALVSANPDLIVMQDVRRNGSLELLKLAQKIAPVIQLDSTIGLRLFIRDFGAVFGAKYTKKLNDQVDVAVAKMASVVPNQGEVIVSHGMLLSDTVRIYKDNSNLASQLMAEAGFGRPTSQVSGAVEIINNGTEISLENLDMLDGDILFLGKIGSDDELNSITSSGLWSSLSVLQKNVVVEIDWRYWNVGGPLAAALIADDFVTGFSVLKLRSTQ